VGVGVGWWGWWRGGGELEASGRSQDVNQGVGTCPRSPTPLVHILVVRRSQLQSTQTLIASATNPRPHHTNNPIQPTPTQPNPTRCNQVDVYSFGIVLWELWTLKEPFEVRGGVGGLFLG